MPWELIMSISNCQHQCPKTGVNEWFKHTLHDSGAMCVPSSDGVQTIVTANVNSAWNYTSGLTQPQEWDS